MNALPLLGVALATLSSPNAIAQIAPRASQLVDLDTDGIGLLPSVATDGDLTAIAFCDSNGGRNAIEVVTSDGRGTAWSAPIRVDGGVAGDTRLTQYDACKVFGQNVYVVWEDDRSPTSGRFDLYFNRSTDGGASFGSELRLDKGYPVDTGSIREWRFVAANANDLYVFFSVIDSAPSGQVQAFLLSSHDAGSNWSGPVRVDQMGTDPADDVERIAIAVDPSDSDVVHMAWIDTRSGSSDVFYRRSSDGGATLAGGEVQLDSSGVGVGDAKLAVEIAVDLTGQNLAVAWLEDGLTDADEQLQLSFSLDGGATFAADTTVAGG
ncbi:MAG: exo-alpha-sialidase, partial [Planctomycetes bacterium]|nr:exo-alpha-sialidase [Planctomycetota bacterium]